MEIDHALPYVSSRKLGEITKGKCGSCKKTVEGVNRKYYCPHCGHVGQF